MPTILDQGFDPAAVVPQSFWRTPNPGGALPDGVNDTTEDISRNGRVAIAPNSSNAWTPVAALDIIESGRSGTDRRNAGDPLYVTGTITPGASVVGPDTAWVTSASAKAFIGHSNQTQGFAFGWRTIQTVGGDFIMANSGNGQFAQHWNGQVGGIAYHNNVMTPALADNWGFYERWYSNAGASNDAVNILRRYAGTSGMERFWQLRAASGAIRNALRVYPSPSTDNHNFSVNPGNVLDDNLLVLWGGPAATGDFSIGMRGSTLAYFTGAQNRFHRFYGSQAAAVNQSVLMVWDAPNWGRMRFERGLPQGNGVPPGGLASGDVWHDTSDNRLRIVP